MFTKITFLVFSAFLLLNIYGCFALLVGGAAGTGTAIWLSDKLAQEFNIPYEQTINAAEKALSSFKLKVTKKTKEENVTQLKSKYTNGKEIWIDIRKITGNSTKVEVRVGAVSPDKEAAAKILKQIQRYL